MTLFSDEADGALDADRKRMFMAMKREVLKLGGYEREYFVSQTPELTATADAVIEPKNRSYPPAGSAGGGVGSPIWPTTRPSCASDGRRSSAHAQPASRPMTM